MENIRQIEKYKAIEVRKSNLQREKLAGFPLPPFALGAEYMELGEQRGDFSEDQLRGYVDKWFQNPEHYLRPNDSLRLRVEKKQGLLVFPSLLDNSQLTKFKYDPQPQGTPGRKVALIHVMHWNGRFKPYDRIISFIRNTALPISTLIHIPAGRGLNPGDGDPADYASVGPNIGKTVFRARQDIQDIQIMARTLKEKMGYEQVGLFTYSIGSLRGLIASMMSPGLFDFGIFHQISNDFAEAVMKGVATTRIADAIRGNINHSLLQKLWSTISPGSYSEYFASLPKHTRIVQCEYDFVFGLENVKGFNDKVMKQRPDIELKTTPLSHTTLGSFPAGWKIMQDNIAFIYRHTNMREYKRSALFV